MIKERKDSQDILLPDIELYVCHIRGDKKRNVGALAGGGSIKAIMTEIEKCEVVCANCHENRTFVRRQKKVG